MRILIAGGAGYIGAHSCVVLLQAGHEVVIVDSLVNSQVSSIQAIQKITARKPGFEEIDIRESKALDLVFSKFRPDAVINFAGHKAVGESVAQPLDYYDNNLNCAIALLDCMSRHGVKSLVFSSSAAVYGAAARLPIAEDADLAPQNPYGRSKHYIEEILRDVAHADASLKIAILRYFNPVGAHPSGLIGEQPNGIPDNLMPVILRVATGEIGKLHIFGGDYDTPDGTAIRDYIHVMDLARGHQQAIQSLDKLDRGAVLTINLGTGKGYSVLEVVNCFEAASGRKIPFEIVDRRAGDVACCYADPGYAKTAIDWQAEFDLDDMCKDAWNWQLLNQKQQ